MATTKQSANQKSSASSASKKSSGKAYDKSSRCWPGYEPVPGKAEHEQGSCRPKAASKNGGEPVDREKARHKQISMGGKRAEQAKSKSPDAAERRSVSKAAKSHRASKSATATKRSGNNPAKSTATRSRSTAAKGRSATAAKKPAARKAATAKRSA